MSEKPTQQISEAVKAEKIASPSKVTPDEKLDTSPKEKKAKTENSKSSKSQTKDSAKKNNVFTITIVSLIALCALGLAGYDFWFLQKQIPVVSHTLETQNSLQTRIDQLEQNLQLANTGLSKEI
jgi:uncharacterized protein HemX